MQLLTLTTNICNVDWDIDKQ